MKLKEHRREFIQRRHLWLNQDKISDQEMSKVGVSFPVINSTFPWGLCFREQSNLGLQRILCYSGWLSDIQCLSIFLENQKHTYTEIHKNTYIYNITILKGSQTHKNSLLTQYVNEICENGIELILLSFLKRGNQGIRRANIIYFLIRTKTHN